MRRRFYIRYAFSMTLEVDAVAGFFEWQHTDIDFSRDDSVLGITKGNHVPVLFYDGQPVAHGYFDIIDYWRNKGYCLR